MKRIACSLAVLGAALASGDAAAQDNECDRQCLTGFLDTYLEAVAANDADALPVTRNVKYTENGVRINLGDGLWRTASAMPTYRLDVIDDEADTAGMLGRIDENGNNNWFALRLKIENGERISQIETLIDRSIGGGGGPGGEAAAEPHPLMMEEIPETERLPRADLARISNTYFTGLDTDNDASGVPFSPECQRRENGMTTANNPEAEEGSMAWMDCESQFETNFSVIVTDIRERRFEVVDPARGLAFGWAYFDHNGSVERYSNTPGDEQTDVSSAFRQPFSFYIAEVFKVVDGDIRQIEAVLTTVPYNMESGW